MGLVSLVNEGVHLHQGVEGEQRCTRRASQYGEAVYNQYSAAAWKYCLEIESNSASLALINEGDRSSTAPFNVQSRNDELFEVLEGASFGSANAALQLEQQNNASLQQMPPDHHLYPQAKALSKELSEINDAIGRKIAEAIAIGVDYRGR